MQLLLWTDFTVFHYSAKPRKSAPHTLNRCGDGQFGAFLTPPPARPPETNRNKVDGCGGAVCINHSQRFAHHYCARAPKLPPPEPECILYTRLRHASMEPMVIDKDNSSSASLTALAELMYPKFVPVSNGPVRLLHWRRRPPDMQS